MKDPRKTRAYEVLKKEFDSHIKNISKLFSGNNLRNLDCETLRELVGRFHTIKGGASFFGLKEISEPAGELEAMFDRVIKQQAQIDESFISDVNLLFNDLSRSVEKEIGEQ